MARKSCPVCSIVFEASVPGSKVLTYCGAICRRQAHLIARRASRRARRANRAPVPGEYCDCGNRATPGRDACERCIWLDGDGAREELISALRVLGEMATMESLVDEMGCDQRTVYRHLKALRETGRVITIVPGANDAMGVEDFRYVAAVNDPARTKNQFKDACARGGYYVYDPKTRGGTGGDVAIHILVNTRRAS